MQAGCELSPLLADQLHNLLTTVMPQREGSTRRRLQKLTQNAQALQLVCKSARAYMLAAHLVSQQQHCAGQRNSQLCIYCPLELLDLRTPAERPGSFVSAVFSARLGAT